MNGRVALVTGGAGGMGRAIGAALGARGAHVVLADLDESLARDAAADAGAALGIAVDVADPASVLAGVAAVEAQAGPVDILVNAAGWDEFRAFLDTDEAFWRQVLAVNLDGCLRTVHATLGGMIDRGWGRVVNIASDAARVGSSGEAVYAAAKGGVVAFTKTIAREAARAGVTANAVCPGPTDTAMLARMAETSPAGAKLREALERAVPMRRLGRPDDVAAAVAFLASEEAAYVTGQTLSVSGGLTMA